MKLRFANVLFIASLGMSSQSVFAQVGVEVGPGADASGNVNNIAIGNISVATGNSAVAVGAAASATGIDAISIGRRALGVPSVSNNSVLPDYAIAIGAETQAAIFSTAVGWGSWADNARSTALGASTYGNGLQSTAVGFDAWATGNYSSALGAQSRAGGNFSLAVGQEAFSSGDNSVAVGYQARATAAQASAMGYTGLEPVPGTRLLLAISQRQVVTTRQLWERTPEPPQRTQLLLEEAL